MLVREVYEAQTLTNILLLNLKRGMIVNFGCPSVSEGIRRVVNWLPEHESIY